MEKNNNSKIRISSSAVALLGAVMIVLGGFLSFYDLICEKRLLAFDYMNKKMANNEEIVQVDTIITDQDDEINDNQMEEVVEDTTTYLGYLEIPKLGFYRGFYHLGHPSNTVEANIELIEGSQMPNVSGGNLIIAGHSGTGWKAFFNELYQLGIGDQATVTYKNRRYTYQITNIYKEQKTGTIAIKRDFTKTCLTLITCTNYDNYTQTVYIAELVRVE